MEMLVKVSRSAPSFGTFIPEKFVVIFQLIDSNIFQRLYDSSSDFDFY